MEQKRNFRRKPKSLYQKMNAKEVVKTTEEERYKSMTTFFNICEAGSVQVEVSREEAAKLFEQIKRSRKAKYRNELFARLERYIGMTYDDNAKGYRPALMPDGFIVH